MISGNSLTAVGIKKVIFEYSIMKGFAVHEDIRPTLDRERTERQQ
jgi:hypothetical protein